MALTAAAAQPYQGKNSNAIIEGMVNRGPWLWWDVAFLQNATALPPIINFFSIGIGQQNTQGAAGVTANLPKTKWMTNLRGKGSQFPPPNCCLIKRLGLQFSSEFTKPNINTILNSYYLELKIDDKVFYEGHMIDFPAGGGMVGTTENSGESSWINGVSVPTFQRTYGDWGYYIAPEQLFSVQMILSLPQGAVVPVLGTGDTTVNFPGTLRFTMDGLTDRSVQ